MRFTLSNKIVQIAFAHSPFRHPTPEPAVYDKDGKRVASGVYFVAAAKEDGTKGTVCKIAIIK